MTHRQSRAWAVCVLILLGIFLLRPSPPDVRVRWNRWDRKVDLNGASERVLCQLPGIGPVRARSLVERRETQGPFTCVEEIEELPGIGPVTLARLRGVVRVSSKESPAGP